MIDANETFRLGLIEKVVSTGKAIGEAMRFAYKITEKGPLGIKAAKKVINRARDLSILQDLELENELWSALSATEDMKEGVRAFLEKRNPQYHYR